MGVLDGKVVVVTGAGRGIGRSVALLCAREGASVVVNDLGCDVNGEGSDPSVAARVAEAIAADGGRSAYTTGDVAEQEGAEELVRTALDSFGTIDALVLATGVRVDRPIWSASEANFDNAVLHTLRGYFLPAKLCTILFRQQRAGHVVMLTSDAGLGAAGRSLLAAESEGVIGLARTVARDVGRYGVVCNAVSAQADTRLFAASADAFVRRRGLVDPEEIAGLPAPAAVSDWQGEGGPWDPDNVAPLIAFLCTDESSSLNGQVIGARGGDVYLYSNPSTERTIHTYGRRFTLDELDVLGPRSIGQGLSHPAPAGA